MCSMRRASPLANQAQGKNVSANGIEADERAETDKGSVVVKEPQPSVDLLVARQRRLGKVGLFFIQTAAELTDPDHDANLRRADFKDENTANTTWLAPIVPFEGTAHARDEVSVLGSLGVSHTKDGFPTA